MYSQNGISKKKKSARTLIAIILPILNFKIAIFQQIVQVGDQNNRRTFFLFKNFTFIFILKSQIWLNLTADHRHFGYSTKLAKTKKKKKTHCYTGLLSKVCVP
jgi:hypothetical protein